MNMSTKADKMTFTGLGLVSLATLMYENLLTRIFSVTMWYHFAFLAISIALFGMTVGAIVVYLFPKFFSTERVKDRLVISTLLFSMLTVVSTLMHFKIRFVFDASLAGMISLLLNYVIIALPFIFGGICVSLALTKFPVNISKLYAADLIGASFGCLFFIYILEITDAMSAVLVVSTIAALGALFFSIGIDIGKLKTGILIFVVVLIAFVIGNSLLVHQQKSILRPVWVKGRNEPKPLFEVWNSFSRVAVWGDVSKPEEPFGWGISSVYPSGKMVEQLHLNIDADAETILTGFDGDLERFDYLKYDVTNIVHSIRKDASVLVIGSGGGRDILSALAFNQQSITGVEINKDINTIVNHVYGDFTGHLDQKPNVEFINDEARSYIAGSEKAYDIIQVSLIDTWAATASGAYMLSENSIYTVEAWDIFLKHLTQQGILTFSRWYNSSNPVEMYRLTSLASAALKEFGVENPRQHIILVRNMPSSDYAKGDVGIGTILVSREPFSDKDLAAIQDLIHRMHFDLILTTDYSVDSTLASIATGNQMEEMNGSGYLMNLSPPVDNSPFFFLTFRLRDIFNPKIWNEGILTQNIIPVYILGALLIIVSVLTSLCIIIPLVLTSSKIQMKGSIPFFLFFIAIGIGFMMVEISQLQRLIIFLGHPTYSLSVVLFSLLLSSGLGSNFTHRINSYGSRLIARFLLFILILFLFAFGFLTPTAIRYFEGSSTFIRILVAVGLLVPIGFLMGTAFPMGMKLASSRSELITPWLWGINGAMSVLASVLAVVVALGDGISTAFWVGVASYSVAWVAYVWASQGEYELISP